MKIAFFVDQFPKLSETFVLNQITGLINQGHTVDIYPASPLREALHHEDIQRYKLLGRCHYPPGVPAKWHRRFIKGAAFWIRGLCHRRGGLTDLKRAASKFRSAESLFGHLIKTTPLRDDRPTYDIIQCHFGHNGLRAALYRDAQLLAGPVVTAFHGNDIANPSNGVNYQPLFSAGDFFLPISDHWRQRLLDLGCPAHKVVVHRMGIDCERFVFRLPKWNTKSPLKVLSIARLMEKKGIEFGIRAVATLIAQGHSIQYEIIGDGPLKENIVDLIRTLNLEHAISVVGSRSQDQVVAALCAADVLMAPSITASDGDQEGIPVVLMEAMALGVLVVSSVHSGIPELVEDKVSGLLAQERDVDGLAAALRYLITNNDAWIPMALAARQFIDERHDIKRLNKHLVMLYKNLSDKTDEASSLSIARKTHV